MANYRKHLRVPDYDYAAPGAYFVTLCTAGRRHFFGEIAGGALRTAPAGDTAARCWQAIPRHRPGWALDEWVIMPNHLHGILWRGNSVDDPEVATPLGRVIGSFKAACTSELRGLRIHRGALWQPNYWEHIIRDERVLDGVREYIRDNPRRWECDTYNAAATADDSRSRRLWEMMQAAAIP